jgi:hypothetical protein
MLTELLRGGSCFDGPRNCRSAFRFPLHPDYTFYHVGFRVVCPLPSSTMNQSDSSVQQFLDLILGRLNSLEARLFTPTSNRTHLGISEEALHGKLATHPDGTPMASIGKAIDLVELVANGPAVPEGRESASVVEQLTDEELLGLMHQSMRDDLAEVSRLAALQVATEPGVFRVTLNYDVVRFARAVLARLGHQPAPPAEGEVIEWVRGIEPWATWLASGGCLESAQIEIAQLVFSALARWGRQPAPPAEGETGDPVIPSLYRGHQIEAYRDGFHAGHRFAHARAAELLQQRPEPVPGTFEVTDEQRDAVRAAVANAIGDGAYDCFRVWEAWNVGTMGQDDFKPIVEDDSRIAEIADAAIDELVALKRQQRHPAPVPVGERLPGPKDLDAEGTCWMWNRTAYTWGLFRLDLTAHSHWLPATALPLPAGEVVQ